MEEWHPLLIILFMAIVPMLLFGYLIFLLAFQLPPIILVPLIPISLIVLYLYYDAMKNYYRQRKLKRFAVFSIMFVSIFVVPSAVYAVTKPNWNLTVYADKLVYTRGENVTIVAVLINNAFLTHSIEADEYPLELLFGILNAQKQKYIWTNRTQLSKARLELAAGQATCKIALWNQSYGYPQQDPIVKRGDYYVRAEVRNGWNVQMLVSNCVKITVE